MPDKLTTQLEHFCKKSSKPMILVVGPTASGKTKLSLEIAKRFNCEIISTDSRQIYRDMDISNDAILPEQTQGIHHHMLRITSVDKPISLHQYVNQANQIIADIYKRGKTPMLVGGTWLYISAITDAYDLKEAPQDSKLREQLEQTAQDKGPEFLHDQLAQLDPQAAAKIHPHNIRYIIRALEINKTTGQNKQDLKKPSPYQLFKVAIDRPREEIYHRINKRVDLQVQQGLLQEVQNLLDKNYPQNLPAMSSLGVKEIIPYLQGQDTLENCLQTLKRNTRRYAKRQLSWYRRFNDILWLTPQQLTNFLQNE